jgi:SAM-dependent methyltransferase
MLTLSKLFNDGDFYDDNYFERGKSSGKGWLENYRWMPVRSFKEALAYVEQLGLTDNSYVLDVGCAKGFIVRALRTLMIKADGCDISSYALSFAQLGCWNSSTLQSWENHQNFGYTHAICKDVLEHVEIPQLKTLLGLIRSVAPRFMCIVPMGDNGKYRIPEYHMEVSHVIAENEDWWRSIFNECGWKIKCEWKHVPGLKDNWQNNCANGNHVFYMAKE